MYTYTLGHSNCSYLVHIFSLENDLELSESEDEQRKKEG